MIVWGILIPGYHSRELLQRSLITQHQSIDLGIVCISIYICQGQHMYLSLPSCIANHTSPYGLLKTFDTNIDRMPSSASAAAPISMMDGTPQTNCTCVASLALSIPFRIPSPVAQVTSSFIIFDSSSLVSIHSMLCT
jgi:hypothetical protein